MSARTPSEAPVHALLARRAVEQGLCAADDPAEDVDRAIETLIEREVTVPAPSADECRRWYDGHPDAFVAGELAMVRHILFAVTRRTPVDALRRKAEETLAELRRSPERFDELARAASNCPSAAQGGALGQLSRGDSVPEFDRAIFGTEAIGVLPTLVNTRFGFHIVAVDRRVAGRRTPFDAVQDAVAQRMLEQSWERALAQYARVLAASIEASGEAASPLLQ